jgi:hypothetical protein
MATQTCFNGRSVEQTELYAQSRQIEVRSQHNGSRRHEREIVGGDATDAKRGVGGEFMTKLVSGGSQGKSGLGLGLAVPRTGWGRNESGGNEVRLG